MLFLAPALTHGVSRALKNLSEAEFCVQLGTWVTAPLGPHSCLFKREQLNTDFAAPVAVLLLLDTYNFSGPLLFLLLFRLSLPTKIHFPLFRDYDLLTCAFSGVFLPFLFAPPLPAPSSPSVGGLLTFKPCCWPAVYPRGVSVSCVPPGIKKRGKSVPGES